MDINIESIEETERLKRMYIGEAFIRHIEDHLKEEQHKNSEPKGKAICKICGKTAEQIFTEEQKK